MVSDGFDAAFVVILFLQSSQMELFELILARIDTSFGTGCVSSAKLSASAFSLVVALAEIPPSISGYTWNRSRLDVIV